MIMLKVILLILLLSTLTACGDSASSERQKIVKPIIKPPITAGNWYRPKVFATWQIQLQGQININHDVEIYIIDLFDVSKDDIASLKVTGKHVICYFSGGSYEEWRDDASAFTNAQLGNNLIDWPGERWLNIADPAVFNIMLARLDLAKDKGCEGVDIDNVDGYTKDSGFQLTANQQLQYNIKLANAAHQRFLAVGLKNDLDQAKSLVKYYDFAVNEQCFSYSECSLLNVFIMAQKPVFNIEYHSRYVKNSANRQQMCSDSINRKFSSLVLPLLLNDSFRFSCL